MRMAYDEKSRGLFIDLVDSADYAESREVADGVVVDFDRKGRAIRIELEDAAAVLDVDTLLKLVKPRIQSGADLREYRERLGLTQQQLGDALDIPRNTIARWERDELQIEKSRLIELALAGLLDPRMLYRTDPPPKALSTRFHASGGARTTVADRANVGRLVSGPRAARHPKTASTQRPRPSSKKK